MVHGPNRYGTNAGALGLGLVVALRDYAAMGTPVRQANTYPPEWRDGGREEAMHVFSGALLLTFVSQAVGASYGFYLESPAVGDTFAVGDTVQIVWQHDSSLHSLHMSVSHDSAENLTPLAAVQYMQGGSLDLAVFAGRSVGDAGWRDMTDGTVRVWWAWVVPDSMEGTAVGAYPWTLRFDSWSESSFIVVLTDALHLVMPTSRVAPGPQGNGVAPHVRCVSRGSAFYCINGRRTYGHRTFGVARTGAPAGVYIAGWRNVGRGSGVCTAHLRCGE